MYRGALHEGTPIAIKSLRVYDKPGGDSDRQKILKVSLTKRYHNESN